MGFSQDYSNVPDWVAKSEGYQTGAMVKYQGNIFYANFWASGPGVGDADHNGWRFYDELYDQTPHTPTEQAKIIAYIPTWRKKEGFNYANDEMYQYITHGIISFLMFSETNLGEFDPNSVNDVYAIFSDVINTGHRNGTRISIALGGAVDYGFLNLMTSIGNNPANPLLDQAVQNVVNFVNLNNLDGVDLDLECWWDKNGDASKDQGGRPKSQGAHPAGYALTLFAQKLKQAMPDKLVSAAIFGTSWYGNNYDPKFADHVDWLGIMTYDLTGSWNASPVGPQTTLFKMRAQESYVEEQQGEWPGGGMVNNPILSVEDSLWHSTNPFFLDWLGAGQKIPRNKIAGGVPIYGYDFAYGKDPDDLSGQIPPGSKQIRYKDLLSQFPDAYTAPNANIKVSGSTPRPPFISASDNYPYAHNIYFETPDTAVAKLNFLKSVGAQGVIIWELSNDVWEEGKSIIKALYRNSGNPAIKPPLSSDLNPLLLWELIGVFTGEWSVSQKVSIGFPQKSSVSPEIVSSETNIGTSGPPALAVYNDKLFCVHEGGREDGYLWCSTFDGSRWSDDTRLEVGTSGPPALALYDGKLFCVHEGSGGDGRLWCCTFDGDRWSEDIKVVVGESWHLSPRPGRTYIIGTTPIRTSGGPALVVLDKKLFCFHEGQGEDGSLWYFTFDVNGWSDDKKFGLEGSPIPISGPPATAVYRDQIYAVYEGRGEDGSLWSFNSATHENTNLSISMSGPPAMATYNDRLIILSEESGRNGWLTYSTYSPTPTPNDENPLSEKDKNDAIKFAQQISDEHNRLFKRAVSITEADPNARRAINNLLRLWSEDGGDIRYVNGQETIYPSNNNQRQRVRDHLPGAYGNTARLDNQGSFTRNGIRYTRVAVQLGDNTYAQVIVPLNPETSDVNSNYYPISYRRIRGGLLESQRRQEQAIIVPPQNAEIPPPGSPAIEGFRWIIVFGLIAASLL